MDKNTSKRICRISNRYSNDRGLVVIDASKHWREVLFAILRKTRRQPLMIGNSIDDVMRLILIFREYFRSVRIGSEVTCNHHHILLSYFGEAGFDLKLVSSVALVRRQATLDNKEHKNGRNKARSAVPMLSSGAVQIFQEPIVVGTTDIQDLSKTHDAVPKAKTELWQRILTHYLPFYFPEADRFRRSARTDRILAFLEMFPPPQIISVLTKEELRKAVWSRSTVAMGASVHLCEYAGG
jgi:hypothetical protein